MFSNGLMWNVRFFSWACWRNHQEISTTFVLFYHYPLILCDFFEAKFPLTGRCLSLSVHSFTMLPTLYFKAKSECQAMDSPGSSFQRTDVTRWSVSWLDIPNNTHLSHRRPENWPVKISMLQARKVCFPTDHLTSRNRKRVLRKSTGRDAQEILYTGFKAICDSCQAFTMPIFTKAPVTILEEF